MFSAGEACESVPLLFAVVSVIPFDRSKKLNLCSEICLMLDAH